MKDFDQWNKLKKNINDLEKPKDFYFHEREIWWCSLGVNIGYEQDGKHDEFERPVLILRKFNRDIALIVPLTTKIKDNKYNFQFKHDNTMFSVLLSQMRLISAKRLTRKIRKINPNLFEEIKKKIIEITF